MNTRLICLLVILSAQNTTSANCYYDFTGQCVQSEDAYGSSSIQDIVWNGPNDVSELFNDEADALADAFIEIGLGQLGNIPLVGGLVGPLFTGLSGLFGDNPLSELYQALAEEIYQLKLYVDKRIEEATALDIQLELGGLLAVGQNLCVPKKDQELLDCMLLWESHFIADQDKFLLPENDIISYEKTLPLFRVYATAYMAMLTTTYGTAEILGDKQKANEYKNKAEVTLKMFIDHYDHALSTITEDLRSKVGVYTSVGNIATKPYVDTLVGNQFCYQRFCFFCWSYGCDWYIDPELKASCHMEISNCGGFTVEELKAFGDKFDRAATLYGDDRIYQAERFWYNQLGQLVNAWRKSLGLPLQSAPVETVRENFVTKAFDGALNEKQRKVWLILFGFD